MNLVHPTVENLDIFKNWSANAIEYNSEVPSPEMKFTGDKSSRSNATFLLPGSTNLKYPDCVIGHLDKHNNTTDFIDVTFEAFYNPKQRSFYRVSLKAHFTMNGKLIVTPMHFDLHAGNCDGAHVEIVEDGDNDISDLVAKKMLLTEVENYSPTQSNLAVMYLNYHGAGYNMRKSASFNIHNDLSYGPILDPTIQRLRQALRENHKLKLVVRNPAAAFHARRVNYEMAKFRKSSPKSKLHDPLREYCPNISASRDFCIDLDSISSFKQRPQSVVTPQTCFHDLDHYTVLAGFAVVREMEVAAQKGITFIATVKIAKMPGLEEGAIAIFIDMADDDTESEEIPLPPIPKLKADEKIFVKWDTENPERAASWVGVITPSLPHAGVNYVSCIVYRPTIGIDKATNNRLFVFDPEHDPVPDIDFTKLRTGAETNKAIHNAESRKVLIRIDVSDTTSRKEIKALNTLIYPGRESKRNETLIDLLLCRNYDKMPRTNLFRSLGGSPNDQITTVMHSMQHLDMNPELIALVTAMTQLKPLTLVEGAAGTGKSTAVYSALAPVIRLKKVRVLIISAMNDMLDQVALTNDKLLNQTGDRVLVIRLHSNYTEEALLMLEARQQADAIKGSAEVEIPILDTAFLDEMASSVSREILAHFKDATNHRDGIEDRRLKLRHLSLAQACAEVSGLVQGPLTDTGAHRDFRDTYEVLAGGQKLSSREEESLKGQIQALKAAVFKLASVVCATPAGSTDYTLRDNFHPDAIIFEEASRFTEGMQWSAFAYYANKAKGAAVAPIIFIGDSKQIGPMVVSNMNNNPMAPFLMTSPMLRYKSAGYECFCLRVQMRMPRDVTTMLNETQGSGDAIIPVHLDNIPDNLEGRRLVKAVAKAYDNAFEPGAGSNMLLINVPKSKCRTMHPATKYNDLGVAEAAHVMGLLLENGARPEDIGLMFPYSGDETIMKRVLAKYVSEGLATSDAIKSIFLRTIDGFQGNERKHMIIGFTVTKHVGFLANPRRPYTALSRCKNSMFIIANWSTLEKSRNSAGTTLHGSLHWLREKNMIVNSTMEAVPDILGSVMPGWTG